MIHHKDTKDTKDTEDDDDKDKDAKGRADVISNAIIGAAIEVHRVLGPGLLVFLPVEYKGIALDSGYRLDLVVEDLVIVELKAVDKIEPIHKAQLLTYLRLTKLWLGLLINFNVPVLRTSISRLVNG